MSTVIKYPVGIRPTRTFLYLQKKENKKGECLVVKNNFERNHLHSIPYFPLNSYAFSLVAYTEPKSL